jgi:hypothetical protein
MGRAPQWNVNRQPGVDPRIRRIVWTAPYWGPTPDCYHCKHRIAPGLGEIQHLYSVRTHPHMASQISNLRPCHGGGARRCPVCDLACNAIAAGNVAPRDSEGRPLPFDEKFLADKISERKRYVNQPGPRTRSQATPPAAPAPDSSPGRVW